MRRVGVSEIIGGKCSASDVDFIEGNPFYKTVQDSPSAIWVIENEGRVKSKIYRVFQKMGQVSWDTRFTMSQVDECFDYMAYYFIEYSHNEFDEDYFRNKEAIEKIEDAETLDDLKEIKKDYKENDNDAIMEYYIMNRVYNVAMGYVRNVRKMRETKRLIEESEVFEEDNVDNKSHISMGLATLNREGRGLGEYDPEFIVECQELDDMFEYDLDIYDEEFQEQGLTGFSMKKFVYALFLAGLETDEEICELLGINNVILNNYKTGFKVLVRGQAGKGGEYEDLMLTIKNLIEGVKMGWSPKLDF